MFSLRCTQRLLTRLKLPPQEDAPSPSTRLGDWYASVVQVGRLQLVLAVSERTLLPVLVPAAPIATLVPRLRLAIGEVLCAQGIPALEIAREDAEMADVVIAKTASRQVTGVLVEFAQMLDAYLEGARSLHDVAVHLADTPCTPLDKGKGSPNRETIALFGGGLVNVAHRAAKNEVVLQRGLTEFLPPPRRRDEVPKSFLGKWRLTETELWDSDALDLVVPAHLTFEANRQGYFEMIAMQGHLDCRFEGNRVEFSWRGDDDGRAANGRGWAELTKKGTLEGRIYFHQGDDSWFRAQRPLSKA